MFKRKFSRFKWKHAQYCICSDKTAVIRQTIISQRELLERYILAQPAFLTSFVPVDLLSAAPAIACNMSRAAHITGLGPMASVAGAIAQTACEAALAQGAGEAIVENGGDIYLCSKRTVTVGIYTGANALSNRLAFKVTADWMPVAICSSSSRMGHSTSLGNCDLACVFAQDASLADSAATLACNSVKSPEDVNFVINMIMEVPGILGIVLVEGDKVGLAGKLPEIVKNMDFLTDEKITRHEISNFK